MKLEVFEKPKPKPEVHPLLPLYYPFTTPLLPPCLQRGVGPLLCLTQLRGSEHLVREM